MLETFLQGMHPVLQALIAGCFTLAATGLGSAMVFVKRELSRKLLNTMLGFAAGVMISASFWSLLMPSVELSRGKGIPIWLPAALGFMIGGLFLRLIDKLLPHLHQGFAMKDAEGIKTKWHQSTLLVLAITLHNIPEGLAIGIAFGAVAFGLPSATLASAIALAIGIALQDFPEGLAVSMPLRHTGLSRARCFWYGLFSGIVEPIAAVLGAYAVVSSKDMLPYILSFAAGAMIFVVIEEVVPESQREGDSDLATLAAMAGFVIMMILDVGLS